MHCSRPNFLELQYTMEKMTVTAYDNGANSSLIPGMNVNRKYLEKVFQKQLQFL